MSDFVLSPTNLLYYVLSKNKRKECLWYFLLHCASGNTEAEDRHQAWVLEILETKFAFMPLGVFLRVFVGLIMSS